MPEFPAIEPYLSGDGLEAAGDEHHGVDDLSRRTLRQRCGGRAPKIARRRREVCGRSADDAGELLVDELQAVLAPSPDAMFCHDDYPLLDDALRAACYVYSTRGVCRVVCMLVCHSTPNNEGR